MIKNICLILLLLTAALFAETDRRLNHYPKALEWLQDADTNGESAYNIGVLYHQEIKDNDKAIEWYKKAYHMNDTGSAQSAANNLGFIYSQTKKYKDAIKWYNVAIDMADNEAAQNLALLYSKKLHQYQDAIFYYKKSYSMGNIKGAHSLGYLYNEKLKQPKKAILWYKKAAKDGYADSIDNLSLYYLNKKDYITGTAYVIASIEYGYEKQETFEYLRNDWKIDEDTIKQAYQLQKTLDIPKHYYDPEFEDDTGSSSKNKTGRR